MTAVDGLVSPTVALDTTPRRHLQREGTANLPAHDTHLGHLYSPSGKLITSPYTEPDQALDLRTLDKPCQLLSKALTKLQPTRDDYATSSYLEAFNWQTVFDHLKQSSAEENHSWTRRSFYVIVFRSQLHPDINSDRLYELDSQSHREAVASGGLLKYWFGTTNANRENLATCLLSCTDSFLPIGIHGNIRVDTNELNRCLAQSTRCATRWHRAMA